MTCEVALPEEAKHEDKSSCERENIAATGEDPAQSGGEDSEVVRTQTFQNGTVVSMLRDGTRIQTTKEGVKLVQYPTGRMSQTNVDGTRIERLEDGTKLQVNQDGSTISLAPDGKRTQISKSGIRIVMHTDGSVVQTNLDGTEIRLNPDGTKVQSNPDKSMVRYMQSQRGSVRVSDPSDSSEDAQDPSNASTMPGDLIQNLRIFKTGAKVQVNELGAWNIQVEEPDGTILQKGRDGTMLINCDGQCTLYRNGRRSTRCLEDGSETIGIADPEGEASLRKRFRRYEALVQDKSQDYQQKLLNAERALVSSTQEYERQCHSLKERLNSEMRRADRMALKLEQWREKKQSLVTSKSSSFSNVNQGQDADQGTSAPALPPLPHMSSGKSNLVTTSSSTSSTAVGDANTANNAQESKPVMVDEGTQWKLMDAQSQFFGTTGFIEESESVYKDPMLARTLVEELQQRISILEIEKQEVEDRLIDLRFSLNETKEKKRPGWARIFPFLFARKAAKENKRNKEKGAFSRHESLLAAVENLKQREERASHELTALKRESQGHIDEKSNLRRQIETLIRERDEVRDRCNDLQAHIDEYLLTEEDLSARRSMEIMPCIDEELHMPISLTEVSPMI